uniref:Uncharacterized protein n=1 Tax=Mustela putorius furo TaxID=9669 RepID=M3XRL0_MUSPF
MQDLTKLMRGQMGLALMGFFFFFLFFPLFSFFPSTTWDLSKRTAAGEFRKAASPIPARSEAARPCGTPGQPAPALSQRGKSLDPKGWGRTKSLWKTSLLSHCLCDWGSCGREDAVVLFCLPPHPHPSPRCQCARTRASFYLFFLVFSFHFLPPPPIHLSFLPPFLPQEKGLSLRVHSGP